MTKLREKLHHVVRRTVRTDIFQYFCMFCLHNPLNNLLIRLQVIQMTLSTLWGWLETILIADNYKFCQDYWKIMGCYFCNIFPKSPRIYVQIWNGSTRLILVNFLFLKSTKNFLQDGGNFVFVAICGGSSHILTGLPEFWRWSGYCSMQNYRLFPPCVL